MNWLILIPMLLPLIGAFIIYLFKDHQRDIKNAVIGGLLTLTFIMCFVNCFFEGISLNAISFTDNMLILFKIDSLGKVFSVAMSFIWVIVMVYTFEYIKHEGSENRFYTFMLATLSMLISLCYAGNLVTMYLCFEMVTLLSMPLVLHSLSKESIAAAKKYLFYSIGGAFVALFGIFYLVTYCDNAAFDSFGGLQCFKEGNFTGNKNLFNVAIFLTIIGFGVKAGMFPLHGWLPVAHPVAPSSASAVLSGVITKAGVISIIRVIYYIVGPDFIRNTWVQYAWLILALITIIIGSLLAVFETNLKKRLAYSSVSQISYILVGLALLNDISFTGAILHCIAHMLIKVCLFLFAGKLIYVLGYKDVNQLKGIGKIMPISTWCFTIASLGLIGVPFTAGFISKWYLATGATGSNLPVFEWLVPIVLLISAILTAGYLFPITYNGFFNVDGRITKNEKHVLLYLPLIALSILIIGIGISYTPLIGYISEIIGG